MSWVWTAAVGRSPRRTLRRAVRPALAAALLFGALLRPVVIRGRSMEPTLPDGSVRLATRWWTDAQRRPARGDVAVIRRAGGRMFYVKRIIALPGETVALNRGTLYINGAVTPEPYLADAGDWSMPEIRLGPDEFFVAGDNRSMPIEDHALGRVERRRLAGRIWP
jgi:signal peptidase I